jgi:hypothetical protein
LQFELDIRYRPSKIHLFPDALSRLLGAMCDGDADTNADTLEDIGVYLTTLVEISADFESKLRRVYLKDTTWK